MTFYSDIKKTAKSIARFSTERRRALRRGDGGLVHRRQRGPDPRHLLPAAPMLDMVVSYQQSEVGEVVNEMAEETFIETLDPAGFENELLNTALLYLGTMYGMDPEGGLGFLLPLFVNAACSTRA